MYNPQLDTFLRVADAGSFLKAASQLYISSSAVIQQINLLEEHCGVRLFERSHRGVALTDAGASFYRDAKAIVQLCGEAITRAQAAAGTATGAVRIGTSLLFKCRLLPSLCAQAHPLLPSITFDFPFTSGDLTRENDFSGLGRDYDLLEGIYCSICWKGLCSFLELARTPICCAVSPRHPLAGRDSLTLRDLDGMQLVMPIQNVSLELDRFRQELLQQSPNVHIIDSPYYGLDTFTACELNNQVLITQPVYADIHTNLVTVPLETGYTLPYGLIYSKHPTAPMRQLLAVVQEQLLPLRIPAGIGGLL